MLEDARSRFSALEAALPWHVAHGDQESPAREALIERVNCELARDIVEISNAIDAEYRLANPTDHIALREYSMRFLHELLMQSPWMRRARQKPLGYPGDYELMNGIYANHFVGPTLFSKVVNMSFLATLGPTAVRARKDRIKRQLTTLLDRHRGPGPIRILSVAAGPAQEVYEVLLERDGLSRPLEIVLYDQDKRALSFCYERLKRVVSSRWTGQVTLVHLHDSIKNLLFGAEVFDGQGAFDAIYSSGLFDYLQEATANSLTERLWELVGQEGTLYIGNMAPDNPSRWIMELHLDWFLVYRVRSEMLGFARAAAPDARIEIVEEATGVNPFVALTRE
jgi:hypothetical protein